MKSCIFPFSKKNGLGIAKNYRGITLIAQAAKVYNSQLLSCIQLKTEKILRKNQKGFQRNHFIISDSNSQSDHQRTMHKETQNYTTIHRFLQGIQFHTQRKEGANISCIWFFKEIVTTIMMLYKNMKGMVHLTDGNINFFNIVIGVLQRDTFALYLFILCIDNELWRCWSNKRN